MSGLFLTFEGGEGSGKSTQIARLADTLKAMGATVRTIREPGGTVVGEAVRSILLDSAHDAMSARAELLLYEAARAELVTHVIEPALAAGEIVLCDRFFDSTTAYQGYGRGLPLDMIETLNAVATGGVTPDRTLVFDLDPALGLRRATHAAGADRLEREALAFHERIRDGFLAIAAAEPARVRLVDADGSVATVAARVVDALSGLPGLPPLEDGSR